MIFGMISWEEINKNTNWGVILLFAATISLGFQINEFEEKKDPIMSMSKYDYINDKFLDHYLCDVKVAEIN